MRNQVFVLCSALFLFAGHHDAHAQGFLKKLGKRLEQKIESTVEGKVSRTVKGTVNGAADKTVRTVTGGKVKSSPVRVGGQSSSRQSARNRRLEQQADAMLGPDHNRNAEDAAPTVRIPKEHTALFAPLGYEADPSLGTKTFKPVNPPVQAADQVAWSGKMPAPQSLTNQSLVDMYNMLSTASDYADMSLSPARHYLSNVTSVLFGRIDALDELYENIQEAREKYSMTDCYEWSINISHSYLVRVISSDEYKAMIRSSLEPLFTLPQTMFNNYPELKEYFAKHGGLRDAHKLQLTKWDPEPNKQSVRTSSGGKGTVVSSTAGHSGEIDLDGVFYIINNKSRSVGVKRTATAHLSGKDVVIPEHIEISGVKYPVTIVYASAFENSAIRSIKLPSTLKEIGHKAFRATAISEVTIPASVQKIEGSAFSCINNLTKVVFEGQSMQLIEGCFYRCPKLQSVVFPAQLTKDMSYDMFRDCKSLTRVVLPKNLRVIPEGTFAGCTNLKQLDIPATVTTIGGQAFSDCGITSLYMPNVTELKDGAFLDCNTLKTITIGKTLRDKLVSDNCWGYTTNFGENPHLRLVLKNGEVSLPSSVKVM